MIDHYDWRGGREAMLRFGPPAGAIVVVAMPMFEEANRLRSLAVSLCRALAAHGLASAVPDLPGQGESLLPTEDARLADWRTAFASAAASLGARVHGVALRSGAAIDGEAVLASRWRLSPIAGATALTELQRAATAGARTRGETVAVSMAADAQPTLLAGNRIAFPLLAALADDDEIAALHMPLRTVRLASDPRPADRKVDSAPLWRRAEPGNDPALAALLAEDIAEWIARCDG